MPKFDFYQTPPFEVVPLVEDAIYPTRGSAKSAGLDLYSNVDIVIKPWKSSLISTGISIRIPDGTYGRIASRSGLALKHNLEVGAGVIDGDYTGEVKVILRNFSDKQYDVKKNDRIAQLIITKYEHVDLDYLDNDSVNDRGDGGFGSTGKH